MSKVAFTDGMTIAAGDFTFSTSFEDLPLGVVH